MYVSRSGGRSGGQHSRESRTLADAFAGSGSATPAAHRCFRSRLRVAIATDRLKLSALSDVLRATRLASPWYASIDRSSPTCGMRHAALDGSIVAHHSQGRSSPQERGHEPTSKVAMVLGQAKET